VSCFTKLSITSKRVTALKYMQQYKINYKLSNKLLQQTTLNAINTQQAMEQAWHITNSDLECEIWEIVSGVCECIYIHVVDIPTRKPPANEHAINMFSSKNTCTCKCSTHQTNKIFWQWLRNMSHCHYAETHHYIDTSLTHLLLD